MLWIIAVALLGGAGALGFMYSRASARQKAMVTTETLTAAELAQLRDAATEAAGPGTFRHRTEVVGQVLPGPGGALKSEIAGKRCVWHRHRVLRRYWEERRSSNGDYRRHTREEEVAEGSSDQPFYVQDETGKVLVQPGSTKVHGLRPAISKFEPAKEGRNTTLQIGGFKLSLPSNRRRGTIGYKYEEWILQPKRRVYVLGEATDDGRDIVIGKPAEGGEFLISVKSEEELLAATRKRQHWFTIGAIACAVLGIAVLAYQFLAG